MTESSPNLARARSTIHLPGGMKPGHTYLVDLDSEYVQERIRYRQIVLLEESSAPPEAAEETVEAPETEEQEEQREDAADAAEESEPSEEPGDDS